MSHFVYILECADGTLYTGYTTDVKKRVAEHNGEGASKTSQAAGAKYTKGKRPVKLLYSEEYASRSAALKREYAIKQLRRIQKMKLVGLYGA